MFYIFEVRDDENMSLPTQEFDTFANAFDYAQDGTTTMIYRIPLDGEAPVYEEAEPVWDWSDTEDRDSLVKMFDGKDPTPTMELPKDGVIVKGNVDTFDLHPQADEFPEVMEYERNGEYPDVNEISEDDLTLDTDIFTEAAGKSDNMMELNTIADRLGLKTVAEIDNFCKANAKPGENQLDTLRRCDIEATKARFINVKDDSAEYNDKFNIAQTKARMKNLKVDPQDQVAMFKSALAIANHEHKPVIYGYASRKYPNRFFPLPAKVSDNTVADSATIRKQYGANVIHVAYPDTTFSGSTRISEARCKKYDAINHTPDELEVLDEGILGKAICKAVGNIADNVLGEAYDLDTISGSKLVDITDEMIDEAGSDGVFIGRGNYDEDQRFSDGGVYSDTKFYAGLNEFDDGYALIANSYSSDGDLNPDIYGEYNTLEELNAAIDDLDLYDVPEELLNDDITDEEFVEEFGKVLEARHCKDIKEGIEAELLKNLESF